MAGGTGRRRRRGNNPDAPQLGVDVRQAKITRAARAQSLLKDELLTEAFEKLDDAYFHAWAETAAGQTDARERLWQAWQIIGKVKDHLQRVLDDGKIAQAEVQRMIEMERR